MMAPVFSKAAWRCVWYMMQNDLIHAWGLDLQLGYCAQAIITYCLAFVVCVLSGLFTNCNCPVRLGWLTGSTNTEYRSSGC